MRHLACGIVAFVLTMATPATAQDDTLAQLRAEIGALSGLVAGLAGQLSGGSTAPAVALDGTALDQIDRLRSELAALTGRTEALEFQIRRVVDDASNRIGDLEFRLTELEGGDTSALSQTRPLGGGVVIGDTGAAPEMAAGERASYDTGIAMLDTGDIAGGMAALDMFLQTYPGSPLSADASQRLARAQSEAGSEGDAARTWLNLYLAGPDSEVAPLALLELGESLGRLEQVAEACIMFDELLSRFPTSAQVDEALAAKARLTCP
jgi:TolA-binding protein